MSLTVGKPIQQTCVFLWDGQIEIFISNSKNRHFLGLICFALVDMHICKQAISGDKLVNCQLNSALILFSETKLMCAEFTFGNIQKLKDCEVSGRIAMQVVLWLRAYAPG